MAKLQVGDMAPGFDLESESGARVTLAQSLPQGPIVLIFYPMDNTPGCTAQLCAVRNDAARYKSAGVTVYGVNGGGPESHQKFITKHNLTAPLLVDKGLAVAESYAAVGGIGPLRLIKRTVVGIGRDGRIVFYKRGAPATDEILAAVS
jgi:peroxiredoxin Q/BCP